LICERAYIFYQRSLRYAGRWRGVLTMRHLAFNRKRQVLFENWSLSATFKALSLQSVKQSSSLTKRRFTVLLQRSFEQKIRD
jgi:hypothetical protein